ncbi:MAG: hypothetical protein JWN67_4910 [Actinomycetia bacterium]|nr:hypothetical protein [Actinomycetes bacterium]
MTTTVLTAGTPLADRDAGLRDGADRLAGRRRSILRHPRFLLALASSLMTIGLTAILLGWVGAAHSTLLEEQVPYLISGGLLGLALSIIGALLVFTHWHTVSIREARDHEAARRRDHAELLEAVRALAPLTSQEVTDGRARSSRAERPLRGASGRT